MKPHAGHPSPAFDSEAARKAFAENFAHRAELGASVSIWNASGEVLSLSGGFQDKEHQTPWLSSTRVLVWSATKGPAAACLLHAMETARLAPNTLVSHLWPAFAAAGKDRVSLGMLLHHQAGLCCLDTPPPVDDRAAVVAALAAQTPAWEPGTAHGYHPRTFGFLLDEMVRRITSLSLGEYWREVFGEPLHLDFWIGLPPSLESEVAPVLAPRSTLPKEDPFLRAFLTPGSLTSRSFASPRGLQTAAAMNEPSARRNSYPGWGGIGTASALAQFYAMLACDGCWGSRRFLHTDTLRPLHSSMVQGQDAVLQMETAFSMGFMRDPLHLDGSKKRRIFGPSPAAFGHPGAGGSCAFADPASGMGFAYVMNQMEPGVLPNAKYTALLDALFSTPE
ncbi:MAG: hypothetical protein RLZZ399_1761 [Verrucomicrobiota bacterium]|jgi:CubicO group peptidase (beta-lactamase class C family)